MLFILFQLDRDHYALEASRVKVVLPLVRVKRIPGAADGVQGLFNYRGQPVPVIDLSRMALGRPARESLSTRLLVVSYRDRTGGTRLLGLVAEYATETLRRDPEDFVESGLKNDGSPYLGPVARDPRGLIQWVEVDRLLSAEVHDQLFPPGTEVVA
ncbi:chemotaxis protein CheW [Synoicihabitans lomoniglobus]|uniref:Chemotaxis protein CheW n=1 Tax=Synoicihabitans lomoniglobus TaxID=2909285 RepID=A0AAF0CRG4_9BACT|nr:chemotaxis protein CheW [Opitutaceae bacterium LMO-M01]WED66700.1 chemotaxis protein CheW [Opitutaceae bacterium LMO-M01]